MKNGTVSLKLLASEEFQSFFAEVSTIIIEKLIAEPHPGLVEKYREESALLLHELFTNAIIHSASKQVEFTYGVEDDYLTIEMITEGKGFGIKPVNPDGSPGTTIFSPPYSGMAGQNFILHLDNDFEVLCKVENENELTLFRQWRENPSDGNTMPIPEHFGLFIITSLGFDVNYKKMPDGKNIFSIKRNLSSV
ncbi:MAG: hypothetical protein LC102_08085 [Ignavibacteriales bacterium]|jgi:hypothetical protein|nr:MAG: hypothetical protein F9K26_09375 [Ignavibacteriaceae bacterium]MBW7873873.1 hypothetical protein [Ignavibacteria bacterium]MCZ2143368.1 hypothetical protein [Ignavibacteriales bacterium]OQY73858.1 MAG: hypothetical protein B6D45_07560 [Ignavibacteriales bacterium UTCHB3]MBV6444248.1 hypothetical protein [Ignavibacteriaceae bacterium]